MARVTTGILGFLALGVGSIVLWHFVAGPVKPSPEAAVAAFQLEQAAPAVATRVSHDVAPAPTPKKTTARWIADTASADAATRAAAITALAEAPRAEALPVLARIVINGEPQIDRVLALQSLRDLALNQGDADGAVRDAIRHVIFHGDDLSKVDDAQEALEIIEESLQRP